MSTANKLTYLNGTKQAIKQAINEDFEVIDDDTTFREYADEISSNNAKYKDLIPKETTNATNTLDISNSSGLDKALVTQYGNTYQETTTGKNLFDEETAKTKGSFDANATLMTIQLQPNTQYTFSRIVNTTFARDNGYYLYFVKNEDTSTRIFDLMHSSMTDPITSSTETITTGASGIIKLIGVYTYPERVQNYFNNVNVQIEKGSTATDYEPYTNGASPNPDYPQEIVNISGKSTLKDVGKNLFDKNNANILEAFINASGVITSGNGNKTLYIVCKSDTTYTISKTADNVFRAGTTDQLPSVGLSVNNKVANDTASTITITTGASAKYLVVFFKNASSTNTEQQILDSIQIEESSTASEYEPYQEQSFDLDLPSGIELCKIDTYKDRIYPLNGKWYLEKKIDKLVLDGSESYNSLGGSGSNPYYIFYNNNTLVSNSIVGSTLYANYFITDKTAGLLQKDGGCRIADYNSVNRVFFCIHSITSVNDFKTWLETHNTEVYYPLETPTTEEITESNYPTLYNQLNNIKLFEGVNHLTFTNESGLDVEFDIEYYKDWKLD